MEGSGRGHSNQEYALRVYGSSKYLSEDCAVETVRECLQDMKPELWHTGRNRRMMDYHRTLTDRPYDMTDRLQVRTTFCCAPSLNSYTNSQTRRSLWHSADWPPLRRTLNACLLYLSWGRQYFACPASCFQTVYI